MSLDFNAVPSIRVTVESMKHQVIHHLGLMGSELGEVLEKRIEEAVESYPWDSEVEQITHDAIRKALESYFDYGEGQRAIRAAVEEALNKTFKQENIPRHKRGAFDQPLADLVADIEEPGELNYVICRLLDGLAYRKSYHQMSRWRAAVIDAAEEYYRRVMAPYEDKKIAQNGDVFK